MIMNFFFETKCPETDALLYCQDATVQEKTMRYFLTTTKKMSWFNQKLNIYDLQNNTPEYK